MTDIFFDLLEPIYYCMSRRNPFDEIERFFDRMSDQFEDFDDLGGIQSHWPGQLKVDVADLGEEYEVRADLPGFSKEEIGVELRDDTLRISADREETSEEESPDQYVRKERSKQSVSRSVKIPEPVEEAEVKARFRNGVLTVTLPKAHGEEDAHSIDIE